MSQILGRDEGEWISQIETRVYATGLCRIKNTPESVLYGSISLENFDSKKGPYKSPRSSATHAKEV